MPRARVRTAQGVWLVLHASPLSGYGERAGDVAARIEMAMRIEHGAESSTGRAGGSKRLQARGGVR